jgi:hypothetical protein
MKNKVRRTERDKQNKETKEAKIKNESPLHTQPTYLSSIHKSFNHPTIHLHTHEPSKLSTSLTSMNLTNQYPTIHFSDKPTNQPFNDPTRKPTILIHARNLPNNQPANHLSI